jgi:hypothetical protein
MTKRLEKIKSARSIGDILDVVSEIAYEFKNSSAIINRIVDSLSAEIVFDSRKTSNPAAKSPDKTYVAPKLSELKTHLDVVNKLYDNILELEAAEALVKQSFSGHRKQPAALAAIRALREDIDNSLGDAFDALKDIAQKHKPKKFTAFTDAVTGVLIDSLPAKSYSKMDVRHTYVAPDATDRSLMHFCHYICIEGLKNSDGYMYDLYYVIITGVVTKEGAMTYYLNSMPNFKAPGKYPLGKEVKTLEEAKRHLQMLLDHNKFLVDLQKMPLPVTDDRANTSGIKNIKGVNSVKVVEDELVVELEPTVKTERVAEGIRLEVQALLNTILGIKKNSTTLQHKFTKRGTKAFLRFILVPNLDQRAKFSLHGLDDAATVLGLSDEQKAALRFALQH